MNRIICFFVFIVLFASCNQQKKAELTLSSYSYDFGEIREDSIYKGSIIVTNSGNARLKIGPIDVGCGCTKVLVEKYELEPRESCMLHFSFDPTGKKGRREEFIIINANTDSLFHIFQIRTCLN